MANQRSDVSKISNCLVTIVLAASMIGSGCAGVVNGSNAGGSGTPAPTPQAQSQLSATPTSASFPAVAMGSNSSQTITLRNAGTTSVTISSASVTGTGFSTSGLTLPMSIAAGNNATFNVVFAPSAAGNATGSISLRSNAPNSPLAISTSGSAVAASSVLSSSASSLDFGSVLVGSNGSLGIVLRNNGNANVTISSVLVTGAGFTASGAGANTTLAPGQTAALNVVFAPSLTGSAAGSIAVASNAGGLSIALTGTGGQLSSHSVALTWDPSSSPIVGYYVYRVLADGTYVKMNTAPVVPTDYTDTNIQSGQTYTYVVTAIDTDNVESVYSDPAVAIIP
jgi:hypothetical protein